MAVNSFDCEINKSYRDLVGHSDPKIFDGKFFAQGIKGTSGMCDK